MKKDIEFIVNKSEITAGTRGASLGPEAIMTAARKQQSNFFSRFPIDHVQTMNHLLDSPVKYAHAKRIEGLVEVFKAIGTRVQSSLESNKFPFVLAADHGSAGGTIAGIKSAFPNKRLGVIWIDAHGDLHTPYTTPSGNMHGMPLATALNDDNLECKSNDIDSDVKGMWENLKNSGVDGAKIRPEDLIFIAVRDTEEQEEALMSRLGIVNHTVEKVRSVGSEAIVKECMNQLKDCDIVYVSFDVDSMDPQLTSHGTGTPVPNGLTPEEAEYFMTEFAKQEQLVCMEIVEVNPCLDEKVNKMAEVTFEILQATTKELEQ